MTLALSRVDLFAPMQQGDPTAWLIGATVFSLLWFVLICLMIRRSLRGIRERSRMLQIAHSWGGYGAPVTGGHQPVALQIISEQVIVGRVSPQALLRMRHEVARHGRSGDPRLRYRPRGSKRF
jgi:hypothetical protein